MAPVTRAAAKRRARLHPARVTARLNALMHGKDYNTRQHWRHQGAKRQQYLDRAARASSRDEKNRLRKRSNAWNQRQRTSKAIGRKAAAELEGAIVDLALLVRGNQPVKRKRRSRKSR